jgi:hypothetical protein
MLIGDAQDLSTSTVQGNGHGGDPGSGGAVPA